MHLARGGYFCNSLKYDISELKISEFVNRPYSLRYATLEDMETLQTLEDRCWPDGMQASKQRLYSRLYIS